LRAPAGCAGGLQPVRVAIIFIYRIPIKEETMYIGGGAVLVIVIVIILLLTHVI
jgi:hypothetical protein